MFLTSEAGNFLIIAIIAVFVIAFALVIYLLLTTKKKDNDLKPSNNQNNDFNIPENKTENNFERSNTDLDNNFDHSNININNDINNINNDFDIIKEAEKRTVETIQNPIEDNLAIQDSQFNVKEETSNKEETSIESVLKEMQEDLNSLEKNEAEIARYEEEEEKNAIISYKELMKYKDAQDKDIILEDKDKSEIKEIIENNPNTVKKFKRSEFISPIFGYNDDSNVTYREIKRPPRKEKIKDTELEWESDRILKDLEDNNAEVIEFEEKEDNVNDNTTRFLDELVDFRKKLD